MIVSMNICLTNDTFPPTIDGVANAVMNYAQEIYASGNSCTAVVPYYPDVKDDYPFPVVRFDSYDTTGLIGYRLGNPLRPDTLLELSRNDFDLIHTHCPFASMVLSRELRGMIRKPVIFTYHTKYDVEIKRAVQNDLLQKAAADLLVNNISACDEVWAVSKGAGENLKALGYQGDYIVMPNGVDLERGRVPEDTIRALKAANSIPEGVPVFLFVGRMMWYKGIRIILDALNILKEKQKPFCMVFVGSGMEGKEIEAYAGSIGLTDMCRFIGPVYNREEIRSWYCTADLMLFPSSFDTNGLVVREASACSLGAVLIKDSCAAEGVTDGRNGILINESAEELAEVLMNDALTTEKMHEIGEHAMQEIYLSWEDSVAEALKRYEIVMEKWERHEYPEKEIAADDFLKFFHDVDEMHQGIREHAMTQYLKHREKVRSIIDRYL